MVSRVEQMSKWPLMQVAEFMGNADEGSPNDHLGKAELARRTAEWNERSALAQEQAATAAAAAARAAQQATDATKLNARYMLYSVVVLAVSSVITLVLALVKTC